LKLSVQNVGSEFNNRKARESPTTMKKSNAKLRIVASNESLQGQPLFSANPEAALPLLGMIGRAQLSIEDMLGQVSRQFIEQFTHPFSPKRGRHQTPWPTHWRRALISDGDYWGLLRGGASKVFVTAVIFLIVLQGIAWALGYRKKMADKA